MTLKSKIPKIPHAFFKWYCKGSMYEELHGDLEEFFYERAEFGLFRAQLRYCYDVLRCCQPYAWKTSQSQNSNIHMFRNFYLTTIRNLLKHKSYFLINISGLSIGIASFTFIALYIVNELSYDRFHASEEQIYRVRNSAVIRGEPNDEATSAAPMARAMQENYPEVKRTTRVLRKGSMLVGKGRKKINEEGVLFADSAFFSMFSFPLIKGNPQSALQYPRTMVMSESAARRHFGDTDPMGQLVTVDEDSIFYEVTGIVADVPANSHLQFDMLASLNSTDYDQSNHWIGRSLHTYAALHTGSDPRELETKMQVLFYDYMAPTIEYYTGLKISEWEGAGNSVRFVLNPIEDIHLYSEASAELEPTGSITHIYIYGIIGMVILAIAIFNFVNLATAHSTTRAKEVGVRKVIGSTRKFLVYQFVLESVLVSLMATVLAAGMVGAFTPSFIQLIGKGLEFNLLNSYVVWFALAGLGLIVGIMAGVYPAFILSAFRPSAVLKGTVRTGMKTGWLRNILVTLQFAASIVIIIGTLVIYQQLDFMVSKNLGFAKEQMLVLKRADWLGSNMDVFNNDLLKNQNVNVVSNSLTIPGKGYDIRSYRRKDEAETFLFLNNQVNYDHLKAMGLELLEGRFFEKSHRADSNAVVLNQAAVKALGFKDPVGQKLTSAFKKGRILTVIGVVKDYNVESLHQSVTPVSLELDRTAKGFISIRMKHGENIRETMQYVEERWEHHAGNKPMLYFFFDEDYQNLYQTETTTGQVFMLFAALSVFIACLGLIGLIAYTASIRRKELGIRKILGAGITHLIGLLSADIVKLMVIATLIAWPLAFFATDYWLQNFADRIALSGWVYVGATALLVAVVSLAISFQTIKASTGNPVDSLRYE